MAGLGLLFAGLSGVGKALASSAQEEQHVADQKSLEAERMRLEEEKALRIDEARRTRDRQGAVQMGTDITAETANLQNQRDAEAINAANGSQMSAADAAVLRNNPEARKAYGLLGSTRKTDLEDRGTAAERLGYLDAARETRGQLQAEIGNTRNEKLDENADKRLDAEVAWRKDQANMQAKREDRMARIAEAELGLRKSQAAKADSQATGNAEREARMATTAALKGVETDIKQLAKDAADPMLAPEQKKVVDEQLAAARREASQYRSALAGAGLDGSKAPAKAFNPDDYRTDGKSSSSGTSGAQRVPNPMSSGYVHEPVKLTAGARAALAAPAQPAAPQSPRDMALSGLDAALEKTGRDLARANSAGNKAEVTKLNAQFQELLAAKQRAQQ